MSVMQVENDDLDHVEGTCTSNRTRKYFLKKLYMCCTCVIQVENDDLDHVEGTCTTDGTRKYFIKLCICTVRA